jgi:hypothetical protein
MTPDSHPARRTHAEAEAHEALVDLVVAQVDRAYTTAGQVGVLAAVRDLLRRMDMPTLRALVHELDLSAEPPRDEESEERR